MKNPLENLVENNAQTLKFIGLEKISRWGLAELSVDRPTVIFQTVEPSVDRSVDRGQDTESKSLCPVDRPVDRPMVIFQTVMPTVDRPADRGKDTESKSLRSVDRGLSREQSSLDGRPGRSAGPPARTGVHVCARRSTAFRLRSTARSTG